MKHFYVTTPIYYVNDRPHVGHAYSTVAADLLKRYHRLRGEEARMLTGLDEHGQKIERRAQELGLETQAFVDSMAAPFQDAWRELGCENDDFIRTTEARHKEKVQRLWNRLEEAGDIYLGEYEDWYCVGCESFKTEKELVEGNLCPMHKKPVERIKEKSYFFRLSRYTDKLLAFYEANPGFVRPEGRFNEVRSFVREGLRDLSISRTSFRWGIPVPNDADHVMYVWLDALTNYISALGGPDETDLFSRYWSADARQLHIVGKDILRFHAIFWPAFLMSAGLEVPTQVWAHGFLTVNGEKMSKSLGNFLPPGPLVEAFGADVLRYYLMREVAFGQDGDFSHRHLIERYNGELANGLGNLLHRMVSSIVKKGLDGTVPAIDFDALKDEDRALIEVARAKATEAARFYDEVAPHRALDTIWELVAAANRYVDQTEPWRLIKSADEKGRLEQVCYVILETLRWLSVMLWPVIPERCDRLREQLGLPPVSPTPGRDIWPVAFGELAAGTKTAPSDAIFPRIDAKREEELLQQLLAAPPTPSESAKKTPMDESAEEEGAAQKDPERKTAAPIADEIAFDDFLKVDLRLGLVVSAEALPKSKKLLRLMIDVGESAPRQILAGISQHYAPEELVGRRVVVVANLPPRKMMGTESHGMVLAVSDDSGLSVLSPDKEIFPGTRVS